MTTQKVSTRVVINELSQGNSRSAIARKYGVTPQAISKRVLKLVNQDNVHTYDNKLSEVLKSASMDFLSDSLQPAKLKKSSTLQSMTAAGICLTHLSGLPKTQINIQLIQNNLQNTTSELQKIENEIKVLECVNADAATDDRIHDVLEIAELSGDGDTLQSSSLNVIDAEQVSISDVIDIK